MYHKAELINVCKVLWDLYIIKCPASSFLLVTQYSQKHHLLPNTHGQAAKREITNREPVPEGIKQENPLK